MREQNAQVASGSRHVQVGRDAKAGGGNASSADNGAVNLAGAMIFGNVYITICRGDRTCVDRGRAPREAAMNPSVALQVLHDAIDDHPDKPVLGSFLGVLSSYGDHPGVESLPEVILIAVESGLKAAGLPPLPEHRSVSTVSPAV